MRILPPTITATLLVSLVIATAQAQGMAPVTVDPRALEPLGKTEPGKRPAPPPAHSTAPAKTTTSPGKPAPAAKAPAANSNSTVRIAPGAPGSLPVVPTNAPPPIVLPPPVVVPTRPATPPPPPTVAADAPGIAIPVAGGLRISFGTGRADLNPNTEASIRALVRGGPGIPPAAENASFTVTSFAAGTPEDPSTARRISLSRAEAVRSVLIGQGIASVRIYVRALGPASPGFADGPPDRTDIMTGPQIMPTQTSATTPAKRP